MPSHPSKIEQKQQEFLFHFGENAHFGKACQVIGYTRRAVYHWLRTNEEFKKRFDEQNDLALTVLEDEAHRRGVLGTDKPVFYNGKLIGHVKEYSDTLLILLLKSRAPHKYKERFSGELTGANGQPLLNNLQIIHVHSVVPIAQAEDQVIQITPHVDESELQKALDAEHKQVPPPPDEGFDTEPSIEDDE